MLFSRNFEMCGFDIKWYQNPTVFVKRVKTMLSGFLYLLSINNKYRTGELLAFPLNLCAWIRILISVENKARQFECEMWLLHNWKCELYYSVIIVILPS